VAEEEVATGAAEVSNVLKEEEEEGMSCIISHLCRWEEEGIQVIEDIVDINDNEVP